MSRAELREQGRTWGRGRPPGRYQTRGGIRRAELRERTRRGGGGGGGQEDR